VYLKSKLLVVFSVLPLDFCCFWFRKTAKRILSRDGHGRNRCKLDATDVVSPQHF